MKKITSMILLVAIFATMFSLTAFAAGSNTFTISTDKTAVAKGEDVVVTVEASGDWANVAMVQFAINFDNEKFSVNKEINWDVEYEYCWDTEWYNEVTTTENKKYNLTRISNPACGINGNEFTVMYIDSQSGKYIMETNSDLYGGGTTTVAKVIFTAKADVAVIDSSCLSIVEDATKLLVTEVDKTSHTTSAVQLKAAEPEKVSTDEAIAEDIKADMTSITSEDGKTEYTNVAIFEEAFNLSDLADATAFGFKIGEKKSNYFDIKGEGTLNAVLAIYGVDGDLTVDTYKTVLK